MWCPTCEVRLTTRFLWRARTGKAVACPDCHTGLKLSDGQLRRGCRFAALIAALFALSCGYAVIRLGFAHNYWEEVHYVLALEAVAYTLYLWTVVYHWLEFEVVPKAVPAGDPT